MRGWDVCVRVCGCGMEGGVCEWVGCLCVCVREWRVVCVGVGV